jgi:hypothetical protein
MDRMRLPVLGELSLATKLLGPVRARGGGRRLLSLLLPFARMQTLVDTGQLETARALTRRGRRRQEQHRPGRGRRGASIGWATR